MTPDVQADLVQVAVWGFGITFGLGVLATILGWLWTVLVGLFRDYPR
jgi:hypothetical protein